MGEEADAQDAFLLMGESNLWGNGFLVGSIRPSAKEKAPT